MRLLPIGVFFILSACAAPAEVNYKLFSDPGRQDSWIPYQLTDTTLVIGVSSQVQAQGTPTGLERPAPDQVSQAAAASARQPAKPATPAGGADVAAPPGGAGTSAQSALNQPVSREELFPVKLDARDVNCSEDACDGLVAAAAVPVSYEKLTLGIEPRDHDFIRTYAAPTYYPNSLRLSSVEFAIHDERQEALDTVLALASGARRMAGSGAKAITAKVLLHLPIIIDLEDAKATEGGTFAPLPLNQGTWWYRIEFLDDPKGAGFLDQGQYDRVHGAILTSACRRINIVMTTQDPGKFAASPDGTLAEGETKLTMGVTVADPDWLIPIPLPAKGSVVLGSLCGADVKMDTAVTTPTNALVSDFFSQVEAMRPTKPTPAPTTTTTTTVTPTGATTTTTIP